MKYISLSNFLVDMLICKNMHGMCNIKFSINYCLKIDDRATLHLRPNFETYETHCEIIGLERRVLEVRLQYRYLRGEH
jgi:hypothetical protein